MGGFLVNVFVRSDDQHAVVKAVKEVLAPRYADSPSGSGLEKLLGGGAAEVFKKVLAQAGRGPSGSLEATVCLVSPSIGGWVGVHDSFMQSQDEQLCAQTVCRLSERLNTAAIAFLIHDGDFLCYWLAKEGRLLDTYNSMPGYFEGSSDGPGGGDASLLAETCGVPEAVGELARLLQEPGFEPYAQLESLGTLLGIVDPTVDFDLLTYQPVLPPGANIPIYEPNIHSRDQYVEVKRGDL